MALRAANEKVGECHVKNDLPVPHFEKTSQLDFLTDFELFPDDTWVETYPKSGTTWIEQIVSLILTKGDCTKRVDYAIPWLESLDATNEVQSISTLERPRGFKSHMPYSLMPCGLPSSTPCKYISVVRNLKDVAVSLYYHYNSLIYNGKLCWDEFLSWFFIGNLMSGDYFDHVLGWWKHREVDNILLLKYEDMKKDLHSTVIHVATFMDHELSQDLVEMIAEKSSFASMKGNSSVNHEGLSTKLGTDSSNKTPFIRKGVVGGWKNYFSPEQSAVCDALYAQKLMSVGLELDFE